MKSDAKIVSALPSLALALLAFATSVHGQNGAGSPKQLPGMQPRAGIDQPSIREREFILRSLEKQAADSGPTEEVRLAQRQIAKDFRQMQVVNNAILNAITPTSELDYSRIEDSTSEIKGCAGRLKNSLVLPAAGKESEKATHPSASNADEMRAKLLSLDRLILSFVHNPIFTKLEVLDVDHAVKARSDLEAILELSRSITRDAQRLKKSSKKPSS